MGRARSTGQMGRAGKAQKRSAEGHRKSTACLCAAMAEAKEEHKPQQAWKIHVHVKEKVISVSCGSAEQRIKWLGHVGIARWDSENNQGWTKLGERFCCRRM